MNDININNKKLYIRRELLRKIFHVGIGIFLLSFYIFFGKFYTIVLFALLLALAIVSDVIRIRIYIQYPLKKVAETIARGYERTYVGAHTYSLAGYLVSAILFDEKAFLLSALTLTFIDPIISLCGILLPRYSIPYNKSKNLVGTLIGCVIAFILSVQYLNLAYSIIFAIIVFFLDSLPLEISDNILYPFIIGLYVSIVDGFKLLLG